ncbi:bifunctional 4-hydroxy-2-oxoglutarate aldolase/2-dehydro-3-deoxy-phosphogluconate aldolase [Enterococcus sp.]|uniref:bifunctional 4-hydroxy-2-oxoglutarate aldolase/2-dehydro-3-deoxy-phosphogluconate aldolase n=1 Tax=Enterococcus sp. TaxID=35783 RepID=UPI000ED250B6|nr:bifunctional 4-hydroxy-2-oxoglutarate aldolase/2-dehydro-3-deoxy-phosphogluconate aldolase [Enterococcus sp.]HCE12956.1 2-dehydro-3-deoxyphosphogluconate aldolase [Enterococcus sp.]
MNRIDYPRFTIIMRGYTYEQADAILRAIKGYEQYFAVEMTLNTDHALQHISRLNDKYGEQILIGAGTVRTLTDAKAAVEAGAKFLLGPHTFSQEMLHFAKENEVIAVPAAMTPSEINDMFDHGADIVKIFPAAVVTPRFFSDVQAPLGELPLMAVGGISINNAPDFLAQGARYLGFGSNLFNKEDLNARDANGLAASLQTIVSLV